MGVVDARVEDGRRDALTQVSLLVKTVDLSHDVRSKGVLDCRSSSFLGGARCLVGCGAVQAQRVDVLDVGRLVQRCSVGWVVELERQTNKDARISERVARLVLDAAATTLGEMGVEGGVLVLAASRKRGGASRLSILELDLFSRKRKSGFVHCHILIHSFQSSHPALQ